MSSCARQRITEILSCAEHVLAVRMPSFECLVILGKTPHFLVEEGIDSNFVGE